MAYRRQMQTHTQRRQNRAGEAMSTSRYVGVWSTLKPVTVDSVKRGTHGEVGPLNATTGLGTVAGTSDDWMNEGRCYATGLDFFTNDYWEVKACVIMCSNCPVRLQCLTWALDNNIEHGIWGGVKGHTLNLLRDYRRRGRYIKQLQPGWTANWAIGGEWERLTGFTYPSAVGRPRGDDYIPDGGVWVGEGEEWGDDDS